MFYGHIENGYPITTLITVHLCICALKYSFCNIRSQTKYIYIKKCSLHG